MAAATFTITSSDVPNLGHVVVTNDADVDVTGVLPASVVRINSKPRNLIAPEIAVRCANSGANNNNCDKNRVIVSVTPGTGTTRALIKNLNFVSTTGTLISSTETATGFSFVVEKPGDGMTFRFRANLIVNLKAAGSSGSQTYNYTVTAALQ